MSKPSAPLKVAFLGAGLMGGAMAKRLLDHRMLSGLWNRTPGRVRADLAERMPCSESPAQAVAGADIVCLCLLDAVAVREVMLGQDGFAAASTGHDTPLVLDFTTSSPADARQLAQAYREHAGGHWMDAPVSGGTARAAAGDLIIYCGGSAEIFARARPVLDILARRAELVGGQGAGQTLKLCAQLIAAPTIVAIAEALAVAQAHGIDVGTVPDILAGGLADSPLLQLFGRRMVRVGSDERLGAVKTMLKDIEAATGMARDISSPVPVGELSAEIYRRLVEQGEGDSDLDALYRHFVGGRLKADGGA